jgi:hypothetical protein
MVMQQQLVMMSWMVSWAHQRMMRMRMAAVMVTRTWMTRSTGGVHCCRAGCSALCCCCCCHG